MFHFSRLGWQQKLWEEQEEYCLYQKRLWVNPWRKGGGRCKVDQLRVVGDEKMLRILNI